MVEDLNFSDDLWMHLLAMKLLILSDLHLVSPLDPYSEDHDNRKHFTYARDQLPKIKRAIQKESPDFVLSLGDLVDWYSEENRDFALEFLHSLSIPWQFTPGNHDSSGPPHQGRKVGLDGWTEAGVEVHNRKLNLDHLEACLLNSHDSNVAGNTEAWLAESLDPKAYNAVFTHVPPDVPEVREAIISKEPHRDLKKYVQSRAPGLYANSLKGKADLVFSGHLHFNTRAENERTTFYILPLATKAFQKTYPEQGTLFFLDTATKGLERVSY